MAMALAADLRCAGLLLHSGTGSGGQSALLAAGIADADIYGSSIFKQFKFQNSLCRPTNKTYVANKLGIALQRRMNRI